MPRLSQLSGPGSALVCALTVLACSDDSAATTSQFTTIAPTAGTAPTTDSSTSGPTSTSPPTTSDASTSTDATATEPATSTTDPATSSSTTDPSTGSSTTDPSSTGSSTTMIPAACGDGVLDVGEACDDANMVDTDACTNACTNAVCGDGIVGPGEMCDDANMDDADACTNACAPASCGDGLVQLGVEDCDDANMVDTDACLNTCKAAQCGDMVVQAGVEQCDDGNIFDNDACSNACTLPANLTSCKAILAGQPNAASGLFMIDPDGNGPGQPFQAYCDMTTDGGGWTLILNRNVNSDNTGQPDINLVGGVFDNTRATNWNFDVDLFWTTATQFVFADKQNDNCSNCPISMYDSAIRSAKPAVPAYSKVCNDAGAAVTIRKLVGPMANTDGTAYQCGASLGWGSCAGNVCHYGTHSMLQAGDGQWSQNMWTEMHFPSAYSQYKAYGNYQQEPTAWCRSCGGGLAATVNSSVTCCTSQQFNAKARWTIWAR